MLETKCIAAKDTIFMMNNKNGFKPGIWKNIVTKTLE